MTTINWKSAQTKLAPTAGPVDGVPGPATMSAILAYAARRAPDTIIRAIGRQAATVLPAQGITGSAERLAEFVAQTCHESGGYTRFEENMHYSARRLMAVWPRRFPTLASAAPYAWDPSDPDREDVALANLVYGARMGNEVNGTDDDDGWDHRGGGMLQHTGAGEYELLRQAGYTPEQVRDPATTAGAAADYWSRRKVNAAIDSGNYAEARRRVNGGTLGLVEIADIRRRVFGVLI